LNNTKEDMPCPLRENLIFRGYSQALNAEGLKFFILQKKAGFPFGFW